MTLIDKKWWKTLVVACCYEGGQPPLTVEWVWMSNERNFRWWLWMNDRLWIMMSMASQPIIDNFGIQNTQSLPFPNGKSRPNHCLNQIINPTQNSKTRSKPPLSIPILNRTSRSPSSPNSPNWEAVDPDPH